MDCAELRLGAARAMSSAAARNRMAGIARRASEVVGDAEGEQMGIVIAMQAKQLGAFTKLQASMIKFVLSKSGELLVNDVTQTDLGVKPRGGTGLRILYALITQVSEEDAQSQAHVGL